MKFPAIQSCNDDDDNDDSDADDDDDADNDNSDVNDDSNDDDLGAGDKLLTFLNLPLTLCTPCFALTDRRPPAASLESLFLLRQFIGSPIVA